MPERTEDFTAEEKQIARQRIRRWPRHHRQALLKLPEHEILLIGLATALLDLTPADAPESAESRERVVTPERTVPVERKREQWNS